MEADVYLDEIVSIRKVAPQKTIDITVSGDNLFYANDILTHNSGMNNSDIDMTNTSESSGTPMTLDFYFAIIRTEELDEMGQLMVKQLKSRFGDINYYKRFVIGVELSKFKLYNIDDPTADLVDVGKKDNKPSLSGGGMKQNFDALNFE